MKNILIVNLGYIGDVINASPVCIKLKEAYPDSKIHFLTLKCSEHTSNFLPFVDEVLTYDRRGEDKGLKNFVKKAFYYRRKYKFDLTIMLTDSLRSAAFAYLMGAKNRIGRACQGRSFLLNKTLPWLKEEKAMQIHVSEHYMRTLKPLGLYTEDYNMGFNYSQDDKSDIDNLIREQGYEGKSFIGLCPCARLEGKNWWVEDVVEFINLVNEKTDKKVLFVGDKYGAEFAKKVKESGVTDFVDLTGRTNIPQLAAAIDKCEKFVSVDTGSMHLALALDIPTVALFYYDCIKKWGPKDTQKHKVILNLDRHGIKAQEVFDCLTILPKVY